MEPARLVNWADSKVTIRAWAKGRSPSYTTNGSLRRSSGWSIFGRKSLNNIFCASALNPSDDPLDHFQVALLDLELLLCRGADTVVPKRFRSCVECFAGCAGLTRALRRIGLLVDRPYECFPQKGVYVKEGGLDDDRVFRCLLMNILRGFIWFAHFGVVCTSWGSGGRLSGGTRRLEALYGNPMTRREHKGNMQAERVVI